MADEILTNEQIVEALKGKTLLEINELVSMLEDSWTANTKKDSYENSNWAYYQADLNGEQRAIKRLIELVKVKQNV